MRLWRPGEILRVTLRGKRDSGASSYVPSALFKDREMDTVQS
jgi:hypothetical protein